ncbi:MAG: hypothetical protein AT713_06785 [Caldivirga sp. JCHS_4]|jgi:Threonine synthase|nr:MAG: hypothetical protein AT713_06785 [Caldivirga sp. JCHS_4]
MVLNLVNLTGDVVYKCPRCGFTTEANTWMFRCPRCGSPLNVEYELRKPRELSRRELAKVLPVKELVSLGEGATPMVIGVATISNSSTSTQRVHLRIGGGPWHYQY